MHYLWATFSSIYENVDVVCKQTSVVCRVKKWAFWFVLMLWDELILLLQKYGMAPKKRLRSSGAAEIYNLALSFPPVATFDKKSYPCSRQLLVM